MFRKICLILSSCLALFISCNNNSTTLNLNDNHSFSTSAIIPLNKNNLLIFGSNHHLYSIQKNPLSINWRTDLESENAKFLINKKRIFLTITPEVRNTHILSISEETGEVKWKSFFDDQWKVNDYYLSQSTINILVESKPVAGEPERYSVDFTTGKIEKTKSSLNVVFETPTVQSNLTNTLRLQNQIFLNKTIYETTDSSTIYLDGYKIYKLTGEVKVWDHTLSDVFYVYGTLNDNIYIGVESGEQLSFTKIDTKTGEKTLLTKIAHVSKISFAEDKILIIEDGKSLRIMDSENDSFMFNQSIDGIVASTIHEGDLICLTKEGELSIRRLNSLFSKEE